jgi:predicted O-methyltransferase YrrM
VTAVSVPATESFVPTPDRFHLTPRYVANRARAALWERAHPAAPWLTPAAIGMLGTLLRPTDRGAEFGSGRSTLWFAERVAALTSVESNPRWYEAVTRKLKERGASNVEYILVAEEAPTENGDGPYARTALTLPDASLDFALVDGYYRDFCAKFIMSKIKPGGLLIIDNINWALPCGSNSPGTRPAELGPKTSTWGEVQRALSPWRAVWTSNGVYDTALFFKPVE